MVGKAQVGKGKLKKVTTNDVSLLYPFPAGVNIVRIANNQGGWRFDQRVPVQRSELDNCESSKSVAVSETKPGRVEGVTKNARKRAKTNLKK